MSPLLSFPPPLKSICSTQWEMPVTPGFSFLDPTLYIAQHPETGALGISRIRTLSPLSRPLRLTCNSLKREAEGSNQSRLLLCLRKSLLRLRCKLFELCLRNSMHVQEAVGELGD